MGRGYQRLIVGHGAHVIVESVEIDDVVAVVVGVGVPPYGSKPQGGDAQVVQISEMVLNAAEIASVIGHGVGAVEESGGGCGAVVRGIAVGETVGHDQVDDVVAAESFEAAARVGARQQWQRDGYRSCRSGQAQGDSSGAEIGI